MFLYFFDNMKGMYLLIMSKESCIENQVYNSLIQQKIQDITPKHTRIFVHKFFNIENTLTTI